MKFKRIKPLPGVWYRVGSKGFAYGQGIVIGINRKEKHFLVRQGNVEFGKKKRVAFGAISIISREELRSHCRRYAKRK